MHQNWYRDYKPDIGRYLTFDPVLSLNGTRGIPYLLSASLRDPQRITPYSYVIANPITRTDRKGLACGPGTLGDWIFPDDWPSYSFSKCCQDHDDCYGCMGKAQKLSKEECDQKFCDCMLKKCENLDGDARRSCEGNARAYCSAVRSRGGSSFDNSRKCCNHGVSGSW